MLDGSEVGHLWPGDELSVEATPGHQKLYDGQSGAKRDTGVRDICRRASSRGLPLAEQPGRNLFRIIFQPGRTLELEPEPRPN